MRCLALATLPFVQFGCTILQSNQLTLDVPTEKQKVILPTYRIEPPDVLLIETANNVRPAGSLLRQGDQLFIQMASWPVLDPTTDKNADPGQYQAEVQRELELKVIDGNFTVAPDGTIALGPYYGSAQVAGLDVPEARNRITDAIEKASGLANVKLTVTLTSIAGEQVIAGDHLVRPDGTVDLGIYGEVCVTGLTLNEAEMTIANHLSTSLHNPRVNVDVVAYNSKSLYVITDGAGFGEQVVRLPVTGNDTVLDAISQIEGLSQVSSKNIWVARPSCPGTRVAQILPVRWEEIAVEGITDTNYQLFPGDRIYVKSDPLIHTDNFLAKLISPVERVFGIIILGDQANEAIRFSQTGALAGRGAFP
jgi:polysaccharide export outer membrane protein